MNDQSQQAVSVYEKISANYAKQFSDPSFHIDSFIELLPKGAKVLDVGCGPGRDSAYMYERGLKVTGIDLSECMIRIAKQQYPEIDFRVTDMRKIEQTSNSFDGVFASFSLIHIPKKDLPKTLQGFFSLLKSGGILFAAIQEGKSEEVYITEPLKPDEKIFLNIISRQELKKLLLASSFKFLRYFARKPINKEEFNYTKYVLMAKKP